eukprot:1626584-Pyramimonas_sp.AAC.1
MEVNRNMQACMWQPTLQGIQSIDDFEARLAEKNIAPCVPADALAPIAAADDSCRDEMLEQAAANGWQFPMKSKLGMALYREIPKLEFQAM